MYEITKRTDAPYRGIAYLVTTADGSASRGSGTMRGVNDVLTALHVVFDSIRGGWTSSVAITPAADTQPYNSPYGSYMGGRFNGRTVTGTATGTACYPMPTRSTTWL